MEVQRFTDPDEFWRLAEPVVLAAPVLHSVLASVVDAVRRQPVMDGEFWAVHRPRRAPFLALHTPPYPFHLPTDDPSAAVAVAEAAHAAGSRPVGANGQAGSAAAFADRWDELTGRRHRVSMRLGLYDLPGAAVLPWPVSGTDRPATLADRQLVEQWTAGFAAETGVAPLPGSNCVPAIDDGRVRLWCDPKPLAMAQASVATGGVSRVSYVYTPPEQRGHGYGSAVTAALSETLRGRGLRCMLYTDLANPTSNGIYAAIGYRRIGETVELEFVD